AITVNGGTLSLQNAGAVSQNTLTVSGGTLTQTVDNALSGTASLVVNTGTTTLGFSNDYSGGTTVNSGATLTGVNSGNTNVMSAFGSGQLNLNGSTLQLRADGSGNNQTSAAGNNVVVTGTTTIDIGHNSANSGNTFS